MKILMLGWEYPPHISGGLGTACEGLTRALARIGSEVLFVVPSLYGGEYAPHMELMSATGRSETLGSVSRGRSPGSDAPFFTQPSKKVSLISKRSGGKIRTVAVPSYLTPYLRPEPQSSMPGWSGRLSPFTAIFDLASERDRIGEILESFGAFGDEYRKRGMGLFQEVARYTTKVLAHFADEAFDCIHAHDWMTYPAGVALSHLTGKPLIVHVHSLEYDRSGEMVNDQINQIEHYGLHAADMVIAVSYYTRSMINSRHAVPTSKVHVVHNGVYPKQLVQRYRHDRYLGRKLVLFLGRVTFQKGPDYFVEAAALVVPHVPDVLFVMAGAGDMLPRMKDRVRELGIERNFEFPGFLKGREVEQMYSMADVYVMPSVSEPFGIAALEAISFDTPVIISRQSGVAEVLGHALKVDFWDVHRLADLVINSLLHHELRQDMVSMARDELKRLRWDAAAQRTTELYRRVTKGREGIGR